MKSGFSLTAMTLLTLADFACAQDTELDNVAVYGHEGQNTAAQISPGYQYFSRADIEGRFTSLSDFLSQINGIQIQQLSGLGHPALISIRGASAQQTRVLINGIEMRDAQNGAYDLNRIPVSQIDSIEIINGGNADQAIGGTVSITTRTVADQSVMLQAGSYGTYTATAAVQLADNTSVQFEHQQAENDYSYPVPSPANDSQNLNHEEALNNDGFYRQSLQIVQGNEALNGRLQVNRQRKEIADYQRNNPDNSAYLDSRSYTLEGQAVSHWLGMRQQWLAGTEGKNEHYRDADGLIGLNEDDNRYRFNKHYATLSSAAVKGQFKPAFNAAYQDESYHSRYLLDDDSHDCSTPQGSCDTFSYQQRLTLGSSLGWISRRQDQDAEIAAYRITHSDISRPEHGLNTAESKNKDAFTGFSALWHASAGRHDVSVDWKRATRIPSLYELYGDHGLFLANEDLAAETSDTLTLSYQTTLNDNWQISAAVFQRQLDNAIVPVYDARGIGRYENTSEAQLSGLEWNIAYCGDQFYATASGSHYDSTTSSDVKSFDGKQLPGTYHNSVKASTGVHVSQHTLEISGELSDDLYIDRSNLVDGETRALLNASYRLNFSGNQAGIRISNLTDNRFLDFTNRPTTGREWLAFIQFNFD